MRPIWKRRSTSSLYRSGAFLISRIRVLSSFDRNRIGHEEALEEYLNTSFHTNATAVVLTTNIFLPLLREGSIKKIVNLSTGMCDPAFALAAEMIAPAYVMSKAAVNLATISYAITLKSEGFIVFALSPGVVFTMMRQRRFRSYSVRQADDVIAQSQLPPRSCRCFKAWLASSNPFIQIGVGCRTLPKLLSTIVSE